MRKSLCLLLAVMIMISSFVPVVIGAEEGGEAYEFFKSVSLVSEDFDIFSRMTRGEFVSLTANILYSELSSQVGKDASGGFGDVTADHEFYGEITALKNLGIIQGDSFGNFYPDRDIAFTDAVTVIVNALNYRVYAEVNGGYPTGYLYIANSTGILKGVKTEEFVYGSTALKLLYNSLFVDYMSLSGIVDDGSLVYDSSSVKTMREKLNITEYDAVLVNNGIISADLTGGSFDDRVVVRDVKTHNEYVFKYTDDDILNLFGYRLKLYVRKNEKTDINEIVYYSIHKSVTETLVYAQDVISSVSGTVEYEKDYEASKTAKVNYNVNEAVVYINGIKKADYKFSDLKPDNGFTRFIDNNGDSRADYILVYNFSYNVIADYISEENKTVFCRLNPVHNIILDADGVSAYQFIKKGEIITLSDIKKDDVISVAIGEASDGKLFTLYVSDKRDSGTVSGKSEGNYEVSIKQPSGAEVSYKISSLYISERANIFNALPFGEVSLYIDSVGNIAYADGFNTAKKDYMYIIDVIPPKNTDNAKIKALNFMGEKVLYEISDNIKVDGEALNGISADGNHLYDPYMEVAELLLRREDGSFDVRNEEISNRYNQANTLITPRLAKVKLNSKEQVLSIDTDYTFSEDSKDNLKAGKRIWKNKVYITNQSTFDGTFFVTSDTLILKVAEIDRYNKLSTDSNTMINYFEHDPHSSDAYGVWTTGSFAAYNYYDVQAYDIDSDTGVAGALLVRGMSIEDDDNVTGNIAVFDKITEYFDEQKEKIHKLYYYEGGEQKSALVDKDKLHIYYQNIIFGGTHPSDNSIDADSEGNETVDSFINVEPLKKGDIIHIKLNGKSVGSIGRELNLNKVNEKVVSTYKNGVSALYAKTAYNPNSIGIPFDQRASANTGYNATYNMELGVAKSVSGDVLSISQPYTDAKGTRVGTLNNYINDNSVYYETKFLKINSSLPITVIEETKCRKATDECEVTIRKGSFADLRCSDSYGQDGFYNASRIYAYNSKGNVRALFIVNLCEEHNR